MNATVANASSLAPKAEALVAADVKYRLPELARISGLDDSTLRSRLLKEGVEIGPDGVLGFDVIAVDSDELPFFCQSRAGSVRPSPADDAKNVVPRVASAGLSDVEIYNYYEACALVGTTVNQATVRTRLAAAGFDPSRLTKADLLKADPDAKPLFRAPDGACSNHGPRARAAAKAAPASAKDLFALAADLKAVVAKRPGLSKDEIKEAFRFALAGR